MARFLETKKFQINEIARIFRVLPHMVGDLENSRFSNIEQQSLEFVKYTLEPWVTRWEQTIQRSLLSTGEKSRYFVKFDLEGLLRGDYQSRGAVRAAIGNVADDLALAPTVSVAADSLDALKDGGIHHRGQRKFRDGGSAGCHV